VLRTNTKLTPLQVMLRYRDLLRVEQLFRQAKAGRVFGDPRLVDGEVLGRCRWRRSSSSLTSSRARKAAA
jgi:hypothetical protein